ncbi:MAG: (2Fe-2S)-binding protein [Myxococcota bacterium]
MRIRVNGQSHEFDGDPNTPLLWVLRDTLRLTGTKFGCGAALCGACTVHLDGNAVRACVTPVQAVGNAEVTTIEGLSEGGAHPLREVWVELGVPQCGYCQPGQLMQAAALLSAGTPPSDEEIDQAMSGNLCRCGTYARIRAAIHKASQER